MNTQLWLGNQDSYAVMADAKAAVKSNYSTDKQEPTPILLTKQDGVGIVNISGSLVNGTAGFMSMFGVTGYGDIREALVAAVKDPEVQSILLSIDSGGGAVAGVHETAQLIQRVDKVKPVVSYAGGIEASAALWLGSSSRYSYTSETALVGSLGVMTIHADRSEQLKKDGINVTIVRAGDEKALANPYEPLSKKAKENLQERADAIYDVFLGHVAASRNLSLTAADTKFGQGKEFVGKQAVDAGLVDAVGTLEDAFMKAKSFGEKVAKKAANSGQQRSSMVQAQITVPLTAKMEDVLTVADTTLKGLPHNSANLEGTQMPNPITQEQLVAMAAGIQLETEAESPAPAAEASQQASTETGATEQAANQEESTDLVAYLKEQNAVAASNLVKATAELEVAKSTLATATASIAALSEIVKASAKTMALGLGEPVLSESLDASALVAEHSRLATAFKSKFKVGAVAATNTSDDQPKSKATVDPLFAYAAKSLK